MRLFQNYRQQVGEGAAAPCGRAKVPAYPHCRAPPRNAPGPGDATPPGFWDKLS
jgi:hypothetical protein